MTNEELIKELQKLPPKQNIALNLFYGYHSTRMIHGHLLKCRQTRSKKGIELCAVAMATCDDAPSISST